MEYDSELWTKDEAPCPPESGALPHVPLPLLGPTISVRPLCEADTCVIFL